MSRKEKDEYRKVYHGKGYGVHSPFAFHLITKVIGERCPYYCFSEINRVRRELVKGPAKFMKGEVMGPKEGELLFRLANYYKPKQFLLIGSSLGMAALYLTAYAKELHCLALEDMRSKLPIWLPLIRENARTPIDFRIGDSKSNLDIALNEFENLDFILINPYNKKNSIDWILEACRSKIHEKTVMIIGGIHRTAVFRECWRAYCHHPEISVTIDLNSFGIAFFDRKLQKQNYISSF